MELEHDEADFTQITIHATGEILKVGDLVTGTETNSYATTNKNCLLEIVRIRREEHSYAPMMRVRIVKNLNNPGSRLKANVGMEFTVSPHLFRQVTSDDLVKFN